MATKVQLEDQLKSMRQKVKDLSKALKETLAPREADLGDNPYMGVGLYLDGDNYKIAKFDYNPVTKSVKFISREDASRIPTAAHLAKYNFEELVSKEIIGRLEKNNV